MRERVLYLLSTGLTVFTLGASSQQISRPELERPLGDVHAEVEGNPEEEQVVLTLFERINQHRQEKGLATLASWPLLEQAAQIRVGQVIERVKESGHFSGDLHKNPESGTASIVEVIQKLKAPTAAYAEIIGRTNGQTSRVASLLLELFLKSPSHCATILWDGAENAGIWGIRAEDGFYYIVGIVSGSTESVGNWSSCK